MKDLRSVSRFFFLKCGCLVLQHHLLKKKNLVCPLYYLCSSVKEKFTIFVGDYFCILFCVPLISLFVFSPINATLSWLLRLYRKYWGWECQSGFSFSFIIVLVLLSFAFPYKFYFIYLFIKKMFHLFTFREREGKKHQYVVASHVPPTGDLACNPGMCLDWESNQWPFGSQAGIQSTEPHQPGCPYKF